MFAAHDGRGIWGVGETPEQARAEAEGYFRDKLAAHDPVLARSLQCIEVLPIAAELLDDVLQFGAGFGLFAICDGVLVPSEEPFDSDEDECVEAEAQ